MLKSRITLVIITLLLSTLTPVIGSEEKMKDTDAKNAATLLSEADEIFISRKYDDSREIYMKAAKAAEKENDNSILTEAYSQIARTYLITNKQEEGEPWLKKAEKVAKKSEPNGWSRFLGVRGRFEWQSKKEDKAVKTFKKMYEFCSEHKLHSRAIDAAHMLAIVGDLDQKIEWSLKAIEEAEAGDVKGWLPPLWNNLGWNYDEKGEYDKALDALLKAREYHWQGKNELPKLIADWSVGHAYRKAGKLEEAETWLRPCLAWAERLAAADEKNTEANEWIGFTCQELGEIAISRKDYDMAEEYFERAVKELKIADMPNWDPDGYQKIEARLAEIKSLKKTREK